MLHSLAPHPSLLELKKIQELKKEALNDSNAFKKYEDMKT